MKENLLTEKEMVFLVLLYFHGERERERERERVNSLQESLSIPNFSYSNCCTLNSLA